MHLLDLLCCPSCGGSLGWERRCPGDHQEIYGVLRCGCHAYPVVAGIPIMVRDAEELLEALRGDRCREALLRALNTRPKSNLQKIVERSVLGRVPVGQRWLRSRLEKRRFARAHHLRAVVEAGAPFRELFNAAYAYPGKPQVADYFYYKFGQPRHLGALAWTPTLVEAPGPVLDFACGPGHLTWTLAKNGAAGRVVGADLYFKSVFLASRLAGPDAAFVCCNADNGLPFRDGAFGAIIAADALHVLPYPAPCLRELHRSLNDDGLLVVTSVPNSQARNPVAHLGHPPAPANWSILLKGMQTRLLCSREIVNRYLCGEGPNTTEAVSATECLDLPMYTAVASRGSHWFQPSRPFERWPHACGNLAINPLYRRTQGGEYRLTVPSPDYDAENALAWTYMPGSVKLPPEGFTEGEFARLVAQWVLVGVPDNYGAEPCAGLSVEGATYPGLSSGVCGAPGLSGAVALGTLRS